MNTVICSKGHKGSPGAMFCQQCGDPLPKVESKTAETNPSEDGLEQLPPGTRLRDRYLIQQQIGQGGFGRTYLAEDTGRFHEKIAIKEFFPTVQGTQALQKAEELFQREAITLHKLQHPQIPRFWETFREGKRLFLVEDFIEGKTYQSLLDQRLRQGQRFNEAEILKLFRELLPVLTYLHRQGVIHRDISPDNIMLRDQDKQVVLIDMGGVKQVAINVATQVGGRQNRAGSSEATCLGKVGYAPDEQLRLGIVAPHSDLYALAVTAIVLMTGKQPQDLLDQNTMNWMWHQELMLSPVLTKILNRMLNRQPSQRFKSADEILQLLQPNSSSRTHAATKPTEVKVSASPVNNSSQSSTLDNSAKMPDEIKGWNWGAFLLPGLLLFPIGVGLLVWIPAINKQVFLILAIPFMLGAKGNEWDWESRKWSSVAEFKAHQRAWTKWGLIITGSSLTLALMIGFLGAMAALVSENESPRVKSATPSPVLSTPPVATSESSPSLPTSTNNQTLKVEIDQLETYTYPSDLFSIKVPTGWRLQDTSESGQAMVTWMDQTENYAIYVNVFAIQKNLTQDELGNLLQTGLTKAYESLQDLKLDPPQIQKDNIVRITWTYTEEASNGTNFKMLCNSFIGMVDDKVSITSFAVPAEQFSELEDPINQIINSYKVNPSAPLP